MDATEPLRRAARAAPGRVAVRAADGAITFAEADRRVNRLARWLARLGVARGDRVATYLPNSLAHVIAEMAVLRAGAVWVAINQRLAPPEVAHMLADSDTAVVLADAPALPAGAGAPCVGAVRDVSGRDPAVERALAAESAAPPPVVVGEGDTARLRYTSGTTGRPKGAVLTHTTLLTSLRNLLAELPDLGPDDVVAHVAPLTHASEALLAPAFWRGAATIVCERFDPAVLRETIARERVTTLFLVPAMIAALVDDPGSAPAAFASLRTIVYGAAPMPPPLLERALGLFGPVLLQIYGMSECPFPVTSLRKEAHLDPRWRGSCGLPTATSEVRIVDPSGADVAPGTVGRVLVRGPQMMREYWRDPAATAAAVIDGWLHSGDTGSLDEAGYLTLTDRTDDVIITGGFNVYPREVELVLEAHPAVAETAVAGVPHPRWGQGVAAWVVCRPGARVSEAELLAHCRAALAGYKKPVRITFVSALPKTPTGKVLRRRLREDAT